MSTFTYNGFTFGRSIRTMSFNAEPALDDTGSDYLGTEITITITAVVNPALVATNRQPGTVAEPAYENNGRGDRLGITMGNLYTTLMQPRRVLTYGAGRDTTIVSPMTDPEDGNAYAADVRNGPTPLYCRFYGMSDHTCLVAYSIKTTFNRCTLYLLSNRWSMQSAMDEHYFTHRTIQGKAIFRMDALSAEGASPDDFRRFLVVTIPPGMKRDSVDVTVSPVGNELDYTVIDREVNYGTGANSTITKTEGAITGGADVPLKSRKDHILEQLNNPFSVLSPAAWVRNEMANTKANAIFRVYGCKGADRGYLAQVAMALCIDSIAPAFAVNVFLIANILPYIERNPLRVVGSYVTIDRGSESPPMAEARMEFLIPLGKATGLLKGDGITKLLNNANEIKGKDAIVGGGADNYLSLNFGPNVAATEPPASGGVRGTWLGRLMAQTLANTDCAEPDDPPPHQGALDDQIL
jgi:hypothetical protein